MVFGLGGGLKIHIDVIANPEQITTGSIICLDHAPSWKIRKSPFAVLEKSSSKNPPPTNQSNSEQDRLKFRHNEDNASVISDITSHTHNLHSSTLATSSHRTQSNNGMSMTPNGALNDITYAYGNGQKVEGNVSLFLPPGKRFDHMGIKIQFLGQIYMQNSGNEYKSHYDFISLVKELQPPGVLLQNRTNIPFQFGAIESQHETYCGCNVSVKYLVRVLVERKFFPPIEKDEEIIVQLLGVEPPINNPIKMEVGIEECLHIEFEYEKRYYHLKDVIVGKIDFLLVRIKIKYMELSVIRRETNGNGIAQPGASTTDGNGQIVSETQNLTKYEIMDGAPVKGETIPVRLYLEGIPADLTPTYANVNNRFSVRYFLNLVLVDDDDRRYFKQQEIILWRKELG